MDAQQGDRLVIEGTQVGAARRAGTVVEVLGSPPSRHYRVRWDDGHETIFFPSADAVLEDQQRAGAAPGADDPVDPVDPVDRPTLEARTQVDLRFEETDDHTDVWATLATRAGTFTGTGRARRHPADPQVPLVGEELAAARALVDLAKALQAAAGEMISAGERSDAHLVG